MSITTIVQPVAFSGLNGIKQGLFIYLNILSNKYLSINLNNLNNLVNSLYILTYLLLSSISYLSIVYSV